MECGYCLKLLPFNSQWKLMKSFVNWKSITTFLSFFSKNKNRLSSDEDSKRKERRGGSSYLDESDVFRSILYLSRSYCVDLQ